MWVEFKQSGPLWMRSKESSPQLVGFKKRIYCLRTWPAARRFGEKIQKWPADNSGLTKPIHLLCCIYRIAENERVGMVSEPPGRRPTHSLVPQRHMGECLRDETGASAGQGWSDRDIRRTLHNWIVLQESVDLLGGNRTRTSGQLGQCS